MYVLLSSMHVILAVGWMHVQNNFDFQGSSCDIENAVGCKNAT